MDMYEKFREIIDTYPSRAPQSKVFDEILRMLFTPQEVALAVHMSFKPKPAEDIAQAASLPLDEAGALLERMAAKVVIFSAEKKGRKVYGLVPTIPGLFEFPFMKGRLTPELEKLGKLWEEYHKEALGNAFSGNPTPHIRIVPISTSLEPVNVVHPCEEVKSLIEGADFLALTNCACRVSVGKCDAPKEVCIIFGSHAKFLAEQGYAREVDKPEAIAALMRAEEAGLVHTSNNSADRPVVICNCCPCCCTVLRCRTQLKNDHAFAPSRFEAEVDENACTGCGLCADKRCFFEAIAIKGDTAAIDKGKCIGCGLCVSACPVSAIALKEREAAPEVPKTGIDLVMQVMKEKGTLEKFMEIMMK